MLELDKVTDLEALNAFVRVVENNLDPQYEDDADGPAKVQGAIELYREMFAEGPSAHTGQLVDMQHDAQDIAEAVSSIEALTEEEEEAEVDTEDDCGECDGECEVFYEEYSEEEETE